MEPTKVAKNQLKDFKTEFSSLEKESEREGQV